MLMATSTRKRKIPGIMRDVLAANVRALMDREFKDSDNRPMALHLKSGVSLSTVQRTLDASTGASIDTIESLSLALGVSPYQLILPDLNIENPQVVSGVIAAEKRLYANLRTIGRKSSRTAKQNVVVQFSKKKPPR